MYCPNCGSNMNDGIRFCTQCGTKLNVDQPNVAADAPKKIESAPGKMTKIQCELCGSTDIMKEEGFFVCQHCGCKYSLEEARKMMIEGKVDVSGSTVKVDTSMELKNRLKSIKEYLKDKDYDSVKRSINDAVSIDADNSDINYILAVINKSDTESEEKYLTKAKSGSNLGIFTEEDYQECSGVIVEVEYNYSKIMMMGQAKYVNVTIDFMKTFTLYGKESRKVNLNAGKHHIVMDTTGNAGAPVTIVKDIDVSKDTRYLTIKNGFQIVDIFAS